MSGNPQLANTFRSSLDRARNMRESFKKQEGSLHNLSNDFGTIETETLLRQNFSQVYSKYMKTRPQEIITVQDNSSPHISHKPPLYPQINSSSNKNHHQQSSSPSPQTQIQTPQIQSNALPQLQSSQPQSPAPPPPGGSPSAFNLHAQLPHSSTNPSPAVIHHPAEVQLPTQALIDILSPTDLKMWQLQRRNEELADRLYETHVILDIIMKKYRDLSHSVAIQTVPQNTVLVEPLSNLSQNPTENSPQKLSTLDQHVPSKSRSKNNNSRQPATTTTTTPNHHISIPISDINKFRQTEFEHRRKLEHKLDETMGIMQQAANYEENQHYKNIEKIRSLEVQNKGLREMMAGSERARELAVEALQIEAEEDEEESVHGDLENSKNLPKNQENDGYCGEEEEELETSASGEEVIPLERSENVDDSREIDLDDSSNYEEKEFSFNFEAANDFDDGEDDSLENEEVTISPSKDSKKAGRSFKVTKAVTSCSSNLTVKNDSFTASANRFVNEMNEAKNKRNCENQENGTLNGDLKPEVNGDEMDFDSYTMDEQVEQILKENSAAFEKEYTNGDHADDDYQYQNGDQNYSNSESDPSSDSDEEEARIERNIREQFTSLTTNHSKLLKDDGAATTQSFQMNGYLNGDHDEEEQKEEEEDTYESVNSQRMQRSSEQKNFSDIFVANACQSMTASRKSDALPKNGDVMFGNKLSWKSTTNNHELPTEQNFNDHDENEENEIDSDEAQVIPQNHKQNQGDSDITNSSPVVHQ